MTLTRTAARRLAVGAILSAAADLNRVDDHNRSHRAEAERFFTDHNRLSDWSDLAGFTVDQVLDVRAVALRVGARRFGQMAGVYGSMIKVSEPTHSDAKKRGGTNHG